MGMAAQALATLGWPATLGPAASAVAALAALGWSAALGQTPSPVASLGWPATMAPWLGVGTRLVVG
jgi:hypothetical protein